MSCCYRGNKTNLNNHYCFHIGYEIDAELYTLPERFFRLRVGKYGTFARSTDSGIGSSRSSSGGHVYSWSI